VNCLLCESARLRVREVISTAVLSKLWGYFGIDVRAELHEPEVRLFHCEDCSLTFFDPRYAGGDQFYSALGRIDWYYTHPGKTEYEHVQRYIREHDVILDVGAGRGVLYQRISKVVQYVGLELSSLAVAMASRDGIPVRQEDLIEHADVNRQRYDLVCVFQVLEHLPELHRFMGAVSACLKPGGLLCIAVPNNDSFITQLPNYTLNLPPHHIILWTERSLLRLADRYGLEVVEIHREPLQDVHREIARKVPLLSLLRRLTVRPRLLVDDSTVYHLTLRVVGWLLSSPSFRRLALPWIDSRIADGQSILVTLRKPGA
jgi:SAM-dependent methyltransferase